MAKKKWFWCLRCERVFFVLRGRPDRCVFDDCDGVLLDVLRWSWFVRVTGYRFDPVYGVRYPLDLEVECVD